MNRLFHPGLAEGCVEQLPVPTAALPESLFSAPKEVAGKPSPHALSILARVASDPAFKPSALGLPVPPEGDFFGQIVSRAGSKLIDVLNEWTVPATREGLEKKRRRVIRRVENLGELGSDVRVVDDTGE